MVIKVVDQINDDVLETAWRLYDDAFREVNTLAVQRHLMYRTEFDDVMSDQRVQKYLCLDDDGTLLALGTYTNDLQAVPLISPGYFARHWPEHYAAKRIWYIGFVAVDPQVQGCHLLHQVVEQMYLVAATQNGLVGLDVCTYNDNVRNLPHILKTMVGRLADNMHFDRIDQQSFWLYQFPEKV